VLTLRRADTPTPFAADLPGASPASGHSASPALAVQHGCGDCRSAGGSLHAHTESACSTVRLPAGDGGVGVSARRHTRSPKPPALDRAGSLHTLSAPFLRRRTSLQLLHEDSDRFFKTSRSWRKISFSRRSRRISSSVAFRRPGPGNAASPSCLAFRTHCLSSPSDSPHSRSTSASDLPLLAASSTASRLNSLLYVRRVLLIVIIASIRSVKDLSLLPLNGFLGNRLT